LMGWGRGNTRECQRRQKAPEPTKLPIAKMKEAKQQDSGVEQRKERRQVS